MAETNTTAGRVLIVDDVEVNRFVLRNIIADMGYQPLLAENGLQALKILEHTRPELILLDISMPEMNGYEFAGIVKKDANTRDIPIIFISAYDEVEDIVRGFELGGEDYITKPFIPEVVRARAGVHLKFHETRKNLQESNQRLQASLTEQLVQIEAEKKAVLYALANLSRSNSQYGEDYTDRLQFNSKLVTQAMQIADMYADQIDEEFIENMDLAAPLCDLGNIAIPQEIFTKSGKLNEDELRLVRSHTEAGARLLQDVALSSEYHDFVQMAADIAHYHHENWNGTGYPEGKSGDDIPLSAQIVSIVSVYCAMTSDRSYRKALSRDEAIDIIRADSGIKFNPDICDVCCKISKQFR